VWRQAKERRERWGEKWRERWGERWGDVVCGTAPLAAGEEERLHVPIRQS